MTVEPALRPARQSQRCVVLESPQEGGWGER
jgi:hypothetical protein